jgi:hypothetical protein
MAELMTMATADDEEELLTGNFGVLLLEPGCNFQSYSKRQRPKRLRGKLQRQRLQGPKRKRCKR